MLRYKTAYRIYRDVAGHSWCKKRFDHFFVKYHTVYMTIHIRIYLACTMLGVLYWCYELPFNTCNIKIQNLVTI